MKRCFVISPISTERSEVREHADDVFEFIIRPAMEELGYSAYRADHTMRPGRVTEQMFDSILTDDLCIAVLTFFNPNVFYELAVAQCAARPLIILIEKGSTIPFDIRDMRAVEYDLKPKPLRDRTYVKQIVEFARSLENQAGLLTVPFGKGLMPLGGSRDLVRLVARAEDYGSTADWFAIFSCAQNRLDMSGLVLNDWARHDGFDAILGTLSARGCPCRFLLMHPENPVLEYMLSEASRKPDLAMIHKIGEASLRYYTEAASRHKGVEVRRLRHGPISSKMVMTDQVLTMVPYLRSRTSVTSPLLQASPGTALYDALAGEFNLLWSRAE